MVIARERAGGSAVEASRPRNAPFLGVDRPLAAATLGLCCIGAMCVYAATRNTLVAHGKNPHSYLERQIINDAIGAVLAAPLLLIGYRRLRSAVPVFYFAVLLGLLGVLSPLGVVVNGAHAWFALGFLQLEPSEFAKLVVAAMMAALLAHRRDHDAGPGTKDVLLALGAAAAAAVLVLAEPALGVAIMIAVVALAVLSMSGVTGRWIVGLIAVSVLAVVAAVSLHLLKPYQEQRLTAFTNAAASTKGTGYQLHLSVVAIGSGQLTGQGFLSTSTPYVPEQQTDFIFTVAGNEGGLMATGAIVGLFGVLGWRGLRIAQRAPDAYGTMVATALTLWLVVQAFINIGMTTGIMPVTGLPLPFISYGGSAAFADLAAVALLLNIGKAPELPD